MTNRLTTSSAIASRVAPRPSRYTRLAPRERIKPAPNSDALIAVIAWGTNMAPYSVLDRPKSLALVKTVLAAGKVTSATP